MTRTLQTAIIESAADLIRTRGVQGTSIADISSGSGASVGAIYHHFPNKNAVVIAVTRADLQVPMAAMFEFRDNPASPAGLFAIAVTALSVDPNIGDLLVQLGAGAATDDELGRQLRAEFNVVSEGLQELLFTWARGHGVPAERVLGLGQVLVGLVLGFATQHHLIDSFDEDAYMNKGLALLSLDADLTQP